LFNALYDKKDSQTPEIDVSVCPYCFGLVFREDGCMAMSHNCFKSASRFINSRIFELFKLLDSGLNDYKAYWCTTCSRPMLGHAHTQLKNINDIKTTQDIVHIEPEKGEDGKYGDIFGGVHGPEIDCKLLGGGGVVEKFQRINAFIRKANELQAQIGKISTLQASQQLLEAAWNAPLQQVDALSSERKLEQPQVPESVKTLQKGEREKEQKARSEFGKKLIIKSTNEPPKVVGQEGAAAAIGAGGQAVGGYCMIEAGVHPDNRVTYAFRHRQPDKSIYQHPDEEAICVEDLVDMLKHPYDPANPFACKLNPGACKGTFYPSDLAALPGIDQSFLEDYDRRFRENEVYKMIGARRRTYRKKRTFRKRTYRT